MSRNRVHDLATGAPRPIVVDITEAQNDDHSFLSVNNGKAANLLALHEARCVLDVLLIETEQDSFRHHLFRSCRFWVFFFKQKTAYDIAIGNHANETIVLTNRNGSDVMLAHEARELF